MQDASGADITDHIWSAHPPSSIDPAKLDGRHVFPGYPRIPVKRLVASRASAPIVPTARTRLVPEKFSRVGAVEPALRSIAAAGLCHLISCAFVIHGFKTK